MESIFTKIINREIPAHIIHENEYFISILDIMPCAKGHTLIIPKKLTDYIFDMEDSEYSAFFGYAKTISHAIKKAIVCRKVGISVIGLEVPHAHIHLIPLNSVSDSNFDRTREKASEEDLKEVADKIRAALVV